MADTNQRRAMLNTTINKDVLDGFRDYCKEINIPMNVVLEAFMTQFADGQFSLKLNKNKMIVDIED